MALDQEQEPKAPGSEAGSGGGLGVETNGAEGGPSGIDPETRLGLRSRPGARLGKRNRRPGPLAIPLRNSENTGGRVSPVTKSMLVAYQRASPDISSIAGASHPAGNDRPSCHRLPTLESPRKESSRGRGGAAQFGSERSFHDPASTALGPA